MAKVYDNSALGPQVGTPVELPINVDQMERIKIMLDTVKGEPAEAVFIDKFLGPATGLSRNEDGSLRVADGCTVAPNGDIIVPTERMTGIQHPEYYKAK